MKIGKCKTWSLALVLASTPCAGEVVKSPGVTSFDTGYTISKVRHAAARGESFIIGSSYEGTVLAFDYRGTKLWENPLSGYMNHDLWCEDLDGDGADEALAANADGTVYCLAPDGTLRWSFRANDAPMYAVCVVHQGGSAYVVCGGYDKNIYYLSPRGELVLTIPSSTYSREPAQKSDDKALPPAHVHTANFLRRLRNADGSESLVVHGVVHTMSATARGSLYLFHPLDTQPYEVIKLTKGRVFGDLRVRDVDGDGREEILLGTSSMINDAAVVRVDPGSREQVALSIQDVRGDMDRFGYRVAQPEVLPGGFPGALLVFFGSRVLFTGADLKAGQTRIVAGKYSFNDLWPDPLRGTLLLASVQSGGSCIHVIDPRDPGWQRSYAELRPPGKLVAMQANIAAIRQTLPGFAAPKWERAPVPVYFMSESITPSVRGLVDHFRASFRSPIFLGGVRLNGAENWNRSAMPNQKYRERRDQRRSYTLSQQQVLDIVLPSYRGNPGIAYWGGHGNDPYMFQLETTEKVIAGAAGKKTVLIYPELEDFSPQFEFVLNNLIYPLAAYSRGRNTNLYIRTKHTFWQSIAHLPMWSRLMSGEFADVFVPAMEETTDKSMELSVAARLGVWTSGATDSWGARCARDNPSFDRLRQHSHQMVPNHFLRAMVYSISSGAQYLDNFPVDQDYMSLLWDLIAQGALYVPRREEIVSFSPVHLSIVNPDPVYVDESNNVKATTFYDEKFCRENPFVFSRLNGTWPGAPVTAWDFSRYAAGVTERRLNFLPPYENGLVLITPPQQGKFADPKAPRGALSDHLHPLYKNLLSEYFTDGRHYLSADGTRTYAANEYYRTIAAEIKEAAKKLPLTVTGEVAWVTAQSSPTHLRLTLIDSGYLNPKARTATVRFHTVRPVKIVDLLNGERFTADDTSRIQVEIPCGSFRFLDLELAHPLESPRGSSPGLP